MLQGVFDLKCLVYIYIYTPPKTNIDPEKLMVSNTNILFQGCHVSFREFFFGIGTTQTIHLFDAFAGCLFL